MPYVLALVVTLALSVAVAAVSYYLVERPILRFKYRRFRDLFGHG
jgi:peptidoglycan/LPS O-acetylase OafA/YrhL